MSLVVGNYGDNPQQPGIAAELYIPDQLIAGQFQRVTETVTASGAAVIPRGTVLGRITASGNYIVSVETAIDGSQVPCAIAADTIDPTAGNVSAGIYKTGEFNANALSYDSSWTTATLEIALRAFSIFVKNAVPSAPPSGE